MEKELVVTSKLEDVDSISQKLVIEVPADKVQKSARSTLDKLRKEAKIPGFRPGKAPESMIKQKLEGVYNEELLKQIVNDTYPEAVKLSSAAPISDPRIQPETYVVDENKPFKYSAIFEIYPKVEPKGYKGLKLEKEKVTVSDNEVETELLNLQRQMTQLEPVKDAKIEKGILARVDFKGTADGKPFEGSEVKDFIVDIEEGNLLPVFEKQIIGMKQGEKKDIEFEYPSDYFNKEVAGKKGSFHIEVKELRRKVVPKLDDQFAKDLGTFKNLDEVKKVLRERVHQGKEGYQRSLLHRQIMETLSSNQPIDVPDVMVSTELGRMLEELSHHLESQGRTLKDAGIEANSFVKDHLEEARLRVRAYLLLEAISELEKITVDDKEVDQRIAVMAMQSGQPEAQVRKYMESKNMISGLKNQISMEKTLDFIIDNAKIKEKSEKKAEKTPKKSTKK